MHCYVLSSDKNNLEVKYISGPCEGKLENTYDNGPL